MNSTLARKHTGVWRMGAGLHSKQQKFLLLLPVVAIFLTTIIVAFAIDAIFYDDLLKNARRAAIHDANGAALNFSKLSADVPEEIAQENVDVPALVPFQKEVRLLSKALEDRVTIVAENGVVLADSDLLPGELSEIENHAHRPEIDQARRLGYGTDLRRSSTLDIEFIYAAVPVDVEGNEVFVRIAKPLARFVAQRNYMRMVLSSGALACILIVAVMSLVFGQQLARTVKKSQEEKHQVSTNERIAVLAAMQELGSMLAICNTISETAEVIEAQIPALVPGRSGALALMRNSRNLLVVEHQWGDDWRVGDFIKPDECWSLRKNEIHFSNNGDLTCEHNKMFDDDVRVMCIPLVAQGEILGIIHIREEARMPFSQENIEIAKTLSREIATALSNIRLRSTLREQAQHDPLTGLHNRRYLEDQFDALTTQATYESKRCGLLIIDVDHFKSYNDQYGHDAGDFVLSQLASLFKKSVRDSDIACRLGGEEFGILMFDADEHDAVKFADELRSKVEDMMLVYEGRPLGSITISVGVSCFPDDGIKLSRLLKAADEQLYEAKNSGRNRVCYAKAA